MRERQNKVKEETKEEVRFEILTAARMQFTVFWVVAPCGLEEILADYTARKSRRQPSSDQKMIKIVYEEPDKKIVTVMEIILLTEEKENIQKKKIMGQEQQGRYDNGNE